jgi:copper homeostasis protein (lipoprotein)
MVGAACDERFPGRLKNGGNTMKCIIGLMASAVVFLSCQWAGSALQNSTLQNSARPALKLPATFKGTLPCADCAGIQHHLDLWPDGIFHLRRNWLGTPAVADDIGRWRKAPDGPVINLHGGRRVTLQFQVKDPFTLRLLDLQGQPIQSSLPYELTGDGALTPTDLSLTLQGMFRYMADAALFEECLTGRAYPVAMEDHYIDLERAYLQADKPEPGAPLLVRIEGDITRKPAMEGEKLVPTVVVRRFIGIWPARTCAQDVDNASPGI